MEYVISEHSLLRTLTNTLNFYLVTRFCRTWPKCLRSSKCCASPVSPQNSPHRNNRQPYTQQQNSPHRNSPLRNTQPPNELDVFRVTQPGTITVRPTEGHIDRSCEEPNQVMKHSDDGAHPAPNSDQCLYVKPSNRTCEGSNDGSSEKHYYRSYKDPDESI